MEISADVMLKGDLWNEAIERTKSFISTYYNVYALSIAVGIYYDEQIENLESTDGEVKSVPRTKLHQNAQLLDMMFQSAILTTKNTQYNEKERLGIAFNADCKIELNKMSFLTKFANFGVGKIRDQLTDDPLESMENLYKFLESTDLGVNFDVDEIIDDLD